MRKSIIRMATKSSEIPTASTADIAFLLILFFMVTTVFRPTVLRILYQLPDAESTERILIRRNVSYIWVDKDSRIYIDDHIVSVDVLAGKVAPKIWDNPELITMLNVDQDVSYGVVDGILDQLKEAKAFKITFATEFRR
ncbi:MAG: biopolymer transporter ExbD [bacterium]|jgi:biopolymer transport protein ExbD